MLFVQVNDLKSSAIIEMYEHKLQAMTVSWMIVAHGALLYCYSNYIVWLVIFSDAHFHRAGHDLGFRNFHVIFVISEPKF